MTTVILHYNVVCGFFVVMLYSNKIDGIFFQFYLGCGFAEHMYLFTLHASAVLAVTDPSVCLCVCWSRAGIVLKQWKLRLCNLHQ